MIDMTEKEIQGIEDFYKDFRHKFFPHKKGYAKISRVSGRLWHCTYWPGGGQPAATFTTDYIPFTIFFDTPGEAEAWSAKMRNEP